MKFALLTFIIAVSLSAQDKTAPPPVNLEHWVRYYQAESKVNSLKSQYESAVKEQSAAAQTLITDCGDQYVPGTEPGTDKPACVAKPSPAPTPDTKSK